MRTDAPGSGTAVVAPGSDQFLAVWVDRKAMRISAAGVVLQTFGSMGSAHGQFFRPTHLEIYSGALYVTDSWNDRIEVFKLNDV